MKSDTEDNSREKLFLHLFLLFFLSVIVGVVYLIISDNIKMISPVISFATFILLTIGAYLAWMNLSEIKNQTENSNKMIEEIKKEKTIKNRSDFVRSVCMGIMSVEGCMPNFNDGKRKRIRQNGFYDGCRAFLGDMMTFPFEDREYLEKSKITGAAACFFSGPNRFRITWDRLFRDFHDVCDQMGVPSGLEDYISGKSKHSFHIETNLPPIEEGIELLKNSEHDIPGCNPTHNPDTHTSGPMDLYGA